MIPVIIDKDRFKYDIHSLVKAFYPEEDVRVFTAGEWEDRGGFPEDTAVSFDITIPEDTDKDRQESDASTDGSRDSTGTAKNILKKELYAMLVQKTGRTLPWGSLTGIRPVRIPMNVLNRGGSFDEAVDYLKDVFSVSEKKSVLAAEIAVREKKAVEAVEHVDEGYSIYIGIPFCPTRCLYCSFTAYPVEAFRDQVDRYLDCLEKEIGFTGEFFRGRRIDTVYIGGGTPTTLEPEQSDRLLSFMEDHLDLSHLKELTVEAGRPDSITADKLRTLKKHKVTRISVNPQTMNDETLARIGRCHSVSDTVRAFDLARDEGFDNINMDIIIGLPGEREADVQRTMDEITKLGPDDLTVHCLAVKRGSRLMEKLSEGKEAFCDINGTVEMMEIAERGACRMGLKPYYLYRQKNMTGNFENTGYAAEGKEGLYNILMMEELQDIVALGAGTVSKRLFPGGRIERTDTVKDIAGYMDGIDAMIERKSSLFG